MLMLLSNKIIDFNNNRSVWGLGGNVNYNQIYFINIKILLLSENWIDFIKLALIKSMSLCLNAIFNGRYLEIHYLIYGFQDYYIL